VEKQPVRQQVALAEQAFRSGNERLAEGLLQQVISVDPGNSKANELLAYIAANRGDIDLAFELYKKAIASPDASAEAFYYLGTIYLSRKSYAEAIAVLERALEIGGDFFEGLHDLGAALGGEGEYERALQAFEKAQAKNPRSYELYYNIAKTLDELKRYDAALGYYDRALGINPGHAEAWAERAAVFGILKRYDEAFASYGKALGINADSEYAYGNWLHIKMLLCDWDGLDEAFASLEQKIMAGRKASNPFPVLATPASLAAQRKCAEIYIQDKFPARSRPDFGKPPRQDRIKIGYFSADFRNHATTTLMVELLERHDRSKFEVIGFSYGPAAADEMRRRAQSAFDRFLDVPSRTDRQIAELGRTLGVQVAVDLMGFTQHGRPGIFACGAAPIQVGYLGYAGTLAASYIDYLLADRTVVPWDKTAGYSEKIAYLPDSYQPNGSGRKIADTTFTRAQLGLPERGFVFACFNNNYKITPDVFGIWMRLLAKIPDSVLWLFEGNETARSNLRKEAAKRGVPAERLIFARRMNLLGEHLARQRAADLFLDTFHFNAHTTASDALWAGLPVLTCLGETFAGRVAASLLNAIGLPELISRSPAQYEALALELATQPEKLASLKAKLAQNKLTYPLFDTARFARNIEALYSKMWQRYVAGLPPEHIYLDGSTPTPLAL